MTGFLTLLAIFGGVVGRGDCASLVRTRGRDIDRTLLPAAPLDDTVSPCDEIETTLFNASTLLALVAASASCFRGARGRDNDRLPLLPATRYDIDSDLCGVTDASFEAFALITFLAVSGVAAFVELSPFVAGDSSLVGRDDDLHLLTTRVDNVVED
jgi:hypothetical protein